MMTSDTEQILDLLWDWYYWPGMTKDEELHIAKFELCIKFKSRPQRAGIKNIQATYHLQLAHLDYLTIVKTEGHKDVHILIITDHFMRYEQAFVSSSQTVKCTEQALWD